MYVHGFSEGSGASGGQSMPGQTTEPVITHPSFILHSSFTPFTRRSRVVHSSFTQPVTPPSLALQVSPETMAQIKELKLVHFSNLAMCHMKLGNVQKARETTPIP